MKVSYILILAWLALTVFFFMKDPIMGAVWVASGGLAGLALKEEEKGDGRIDR